MPSMKQIVLLLTAMLLLNACNNSGDEKAPGKSRADSLMDDVMHGHNIGMAKMSKVSAAEKKVQQAIDSISKLPPGLQKQSSTYGIQLDSLLRQLQFADYAMNKWMDEFNMDSEANNSERRIKYLESEREKVLKVKDTMLSTLKRFDSLFKRTL